jgi:hypothetical protein
MPSAVPNTVEYLISLFETTLPSVQVWFGKALGVYKAPQTLQMTGVDGDSVWAELGQNFKRDETFAVMCQISSYAGDQSTQANINRMDEVYALLEPLQIAVANDYTLGGNVRLSEIRNFEYVPDEDAKGQSIGHLTFEVYCQVRITTLNSGPNEP